MDAPDEPQASLEQHYEAWHDFNSDRAEHRRWLEEFTRQDPIPPGKSADLAAELLANTASQKEAAEKRLAEEFGIDMRQQRFLPAARPLQSNPERIALLDAINNWLRWYLVWEGQQRVIEEATAQGQPAHLAAMWVYQLVAEAEATVQASLIDHLNEPSAREHYLRLLWTWTRTQIATFRHPRIRRALADHARANVSSDEPPSLDAALADLLPGAVFVAWRETGLNFDPHSLVSRAGYHMTKEGPAATVPLPPEGSAQPPALEEFASRELLLHDMTRSAGLSPREAEVVQLLAEEWTETMIATRLQVTKGTVRQLKARAKAKLRAALDR